MEALLGGAVGVASPDGTGTPGQAASLAAFDTVQRRDVGGARVGVVAGRGSRRRRFERGDRARRQARARGAGIARTWAGEGRREFEATRE